MDLQVPHVVNNTSMVQDEIVDRMLLPWDFQRCELDLIRPQSRLSDRMYGSDPFDTQAFQQYPFDHPRAPTPPLLQTWHDAVDQERHQAHTQMMDNGSQKRRPLKVGQWLLDRKDRGSLSKIAPHHNVAHISNPFGAFSTISRCHPEVNPLQSRS